MALLLTKALFRIIPQQKSNLPSYLVNKISGAEMITSLVVVVLAEVLHLLCSFKLCLVYRLLINKMVKTLYVLLLMTLVHGQTPKFARLPDKTGNKLSVWADYSYRVSSIF